MKQKKILTSVKVLESDYEAFKLNSIRKKTTFTKLVETALRLYNDEDNNFFKEAVDD